MFRRLSAVVVVAGVLMLVFAGAPHGATQIRLARQPDYHAGRIAFSYLGDIWTATETGADPDRITDHRGHDMYPRFSPDGKWIAFSSNRYGNNDVFVVPAGGGATQRLTFHPGADDVVGWTRDSTKVLIRSARGAGAFPNVATLWEVPVGGGPEAAAAGRLGLLRQLLARRQVARLQPPSRHAGRGSTIAAASPRISGSRTSPPRPTRSCCPTSATTAIGRCGAPTTRSISSPIRCRTTARSCPGSPEVRKSANNIYKIPAERRSAGAGHPSPGRQPVLAVDVERRQGDRLRVDVRPLEAGRRERQVERDPDRDRQRRQGQRERRRSRAQRGRLVRSVAVGPPRRDLRARPDPHDRHRARRRDARRARPDGVAQSVPEVVAPTASYIAYLSDTSGRDEIWISDPDGKARRRSPTSTTRRARSSGRRTRPRSSTPPPTSACIATPSPTTRR